MARPLARPPAAKARLLRIAGRTVAGYIKLVRRTSRLISEPDDIAGMFRALHPSIVALWHGQFLMVPGVNPGNVPVAAMVAKHGDAELIGAALESLGLSLVRGAGAGGRRRDRGGMRALRESYRALEAGTTIVMTADVPPGPARRAGLGIVALARLSGRPILPAAVASSRYAALRTWSRMTLNLPFSRLVVIAGTPVHVPADADEAMLERCRQQVEDELNRVTARAYQLAGADSRRATPPGARIAGLDGPASPGFQLKAYRWLTRLATPTAPLILRYRRGRGKEDGQRLSERIGRASAARPDGVLAWVHAASVGETNAILPLISAIRTRRPDVRFLLTTGTQTSAALAARRLDPRDIHQYVPLDAPAIVARFLDHWRPDLAVLTESEIWPNLLIEASARGVPVALVNARMSRRSFGRWKRLPGMALPLFSRIDLVLAQNEKLARRFAELGARDSRAAGNLKIDAPPPPADAAALAGLREATAGRPVLVAASTHAGEEAVVLAAHAALARRLDGLLTIIAPRHPDRGGEVLALAAQAGLKGRRRAAGELPRTGDDIHVADTMGELGTLYALAPVAFVGGSLIERGGQNPIEAIRHGAAVLTGPHWDNFADVYRALLRHQGAIEVRSAEDLASAVERLMGDQVELTRMRQGAMAAVESLSGALERTVTALIAMLPPPIPSTVGAAGQRSEGLQRAV